MSNNGFLITKREGLINFNDPQTHSVLVTTQSNDKLGSLYSAYEELHKLSTTSSFNPLISAKLVDLYNSSRFYSSCEVSYIAYYVKTNIPIIVNDG